MKRIGVIIIGVFLSLRGHAQFTEIPTGTTSGISDLALHGDTLLISGYPNYFAKYTINTGELEELPAPGIVGYGNMDLQVVNNNYYIFSMQGFPYEHNYILKSTNYGGSWDTLFHTPGLFYTMSIADSTFGVLGGAYGSHAITNGSDTAWVLQDSLYGTIMSSAIYGDSTAILESTGTGYSYLFYNREFIWGEYGVDYYGSPFGSPRETQFLSEDTIVSISNQGVGDQTSYFRRSTNDGESWGNTNISPCNLNIPDYDCYSEANDLYMNNNGIGYILAYVEKTYYDWSGTIVEKTCIFQTDDYGDNWTSYVTDISEEMYSMVFLNDSTAFIGGENGLLYKWDLTVPLSNVLNTQEISANIGLQLFPNPFSKSTSFKLSTTSAELPVILYVYDQLGREIRTETIQKPEFTFYRNGLKAGVYYYRINDYTGKFIIVN